MPVPGPGGELYIYDSDLPRIFLAWDGSGWRALPDVPNTPDVTIVAATANRATGDLFAVLLDGTSLSVVRLEGDTWRPVGDTIETDGRLAYLLRQVSIAANGDSVAVAYATASDISVATLAASGWQVSSAATHGGVQIASVRNEIGPEEGLLVSWVQDGSLQVAVFDDTSWRVLPDVAGAFHLFARATLRVDDGVPIALFQRGFPNLVGPFDLAAGTWKDGAWHLSQPLSTASWGSPVLSRDGDGLSSVLTGESVSFTLLHAPR
jgi:hypothetical protein